MSERPDDIPEDAVSMRALLSTPLCHPVELRFKSSGKIALKWCKACHAWLERVEGNSPCPVIAARKAAP